MSLGYKCEKKVCYVGLEYEVKSANNKVQNCSSGAIARRKKSEKQLKERRILEFLLIKGASLEKRKKDVIFIKSSGVSLSSGISVDILDDLCSSGAIKSSLHLGRPIFSITEEGLLRLKRDENYGSDKNEAFASQHRILKRQEIIDNIDKNQVVVNIKEDPFYVFRSNRHLRHLVGSAELEAGDRFSRDLHFSQILPKVTSSWSGVIVDNNSRYNGLNASEVMIEAKRRVDAAIAAINPDFINLLLDVCGFCKGIEMIEKEHDLPVRSGKLAIAYALRELARHYGLSNAACGKSRVITKTKLARQVAKNAN